MTQAELESLLNKLPARATLFIPTEVAEAMAGNRDEGTLMEEIDQKYNCDLDVRQSLVNGIVTLAHMPRENGRRLRVSRCSGHGIPPIHRFSSELAQCSA